jgi:quercetin dioxygenase-like cupin family protein
MKGLKIGFIGSLLFTALIGSKASAAGLSFDFPEIATDPDAPSYLWIDGEPFTFIKRGETTKGAFTIRQTDVPPGKGAPAHFHQNEDEWLYVEEGTLRITIGETDYKDAGLIPGVNAPEGTIHAYDAPEGSLIYGKQFRTHGVLNPTEETAKLKVIWAPSGFEDIFLEPGIIPVEDFENPPEAPADYNQTIFGIANKFGLSVPELEPEQFGDVVFDDYVINQDNHASELRAIFAKGGVKFDTPETTVPEPSFLGALLLIGASGTVSVLRRRKHRQLADAAVS